MLFAARAPFYVAYHKRVQFVESNLVILSKIIQETNSHVTLAVVVKENHAHTHKLQGSRAILSLMPVEPLAAWEYKFSNRNYQFCDSKSFHIGRRLHPSAVRSFEVTMEMQRLPIPDLKEAELVWLWRISQPGEYALCIESNGIIDYMGTVGVPGPRFTSVTQDLTGPEVALDAGKNGSTQVIKAHTCTRVNLAFSAVISTTSDLLLGGLSFIPVKGRPMCPIGGVSAGSVIKPLFYEEMRHDGPAPNYVERVVTASVMFEAPGRYAVCFVRSGDMRLQHQTGAVDDIYQTLLRGQPPPEGEEQQQEHAPTTAPSLPFLILGVNKTNKRKAPTVAEMQTPTVVVVRWPSSPSYFVDWTTTTPESATKKGKGTSTSVEILVSVPSNCGLKRVWKTQCSSRSAVPVAQVKGERGNTFRVTVTAKTIADCVGHPMIIMFDTKNGISHKVVEVTDFISGINTEDDSATEQQQPSSVSSSATGESMDRQPSSAPVDDTAPTPDIEESENLCPSKDAPCEGGVDEKETQPKAALFAEEELMLGFNM